MNKKDKFVTPNKRILIDNTYKKIDSLIIFLLWLICITYLLIIPLFGNINRQEIIPINTELYS